jgi:RNA binding exosome subunit
LVYSSHSYIFRTDDCDILATDIQEKTPKEVKYYLVFRKQLAGKTVTVTVELL